MSFSTNNLELIGREDQSALLIKDSRYFQQWTGKHEFNCKFSVTSPLELGVVAVIQQMSFRRNAADCIDYVQVCYLFGCSFIYFIAGINKPNLFL